MRKSDTKIISLSVPMKNIVWNTYIIMLYSMWEKIKYNRTYTKIIKYGKRLYGKYLNLYYIHDQEFQKDLMLGIIVGKKVGNAVKRNKIKRWIREYFNLYSKDIGSAGAYVFIAQKSSNLASWNEIKKDISLLIGKTKPRIYTYRHR